MDKEEVARHIVDSAVAIHPVHRAQLLTYLKLSGCSIGFLINWKVSRIKDGIQRMIWHE
jgi:GxxExxY protein